MSINNNNKKTKKFTSNSDTTTCLEKEKIFRDACLLRAINI